MLSEIEMETLRELARSADAAWIENEIDSRLSFKENKRILKDFLKTNDKILDLKTELLADKTLDERMAAKVKEDIDFEESRRFQEVISRAQEINSKIQSIQKEIMEEIEAYNPYVKNMTYATLFASMNGQLGSQKPHVINKGKQGIGKSRSTTELAEKLDLPDALIIHGYMTPKRMYDLLKHNRFSMVILDESEAVMNNPQALYILRSALYGGDVSWLSTKGDPLDSFKFEGTLICNLNHLGVNELESAPLYDRTLFNEISLDSMQIVQKMRSTSLYKMNEDIWSVIKDKVTLTRGLGLAALSEEEKNKILDFVESIARNSSVFSKSMSTRALHRAHLVAAGLKTLFCGIDESVWKLFEELTKPYIVQDDIENLAVKILLSRPTLTRLELTEIISEQKGISERQASRYIKASIDAGSLESKNRWHIAVVKSKNISNEVSQ